MVDLKPLRRLKKVTKVNLFLGKTKIDDVSPISNLPNLERLTIVHASKYMLDTLPSNVRSVKVSDAILEDQAR
jgi:Leucine-rich repeat (LRR) protein